MYVTKEPYTMITGHLTHLWRWWLKNDDGKIQHFPAQIQHNTEVSKAKKQFLKNNKDGKVYFKDMTK